MIALVILLFAILLVVLVVALPILSGLTEVGKSKRSSTSKRAEINHNKQQKNDFTGYLPPDEEAALRNKEAEEHTLRARASAIKAKLDLKSDDIPLQIKLKQLENQDSSLRRRNKEKLDTDSNPNNYDYDLDDLIKEESEQAHKDQQREYYKNVELGKEKEEMV